MRPAGRLLSPGPIDIRPVMAAMRKTSPVDRGRSRVLDRVLHNARWLAGSTGLSAITSIASLALTARTLGPRDFGSYALVMTYAQLIGDLVQFSSWNAVIRYGAGHMVNGDQPALRRLFGLTAALDWASAIVAVALALMLVPLIESYLHWSPLDAEYVAWFGTAFLLTTGATATGILRLFDRFDLLVYSDAAGPLTRLVGALIGAWMGGGVAWFLGVWAGAAILQLLAQWTAALWIGNRLTLRFTALRKATVENSRILRFMFKTNLSSSIEQLWMQAGTLAVGWTSGPVEAGGFRIAQRFSHALAKPITIMTRALFPEFARLVAARDHKTNRDILLHVTVIGVCCAIVVVAIAGLLGKEILYLLAGPKFEFANRFLFLLTVAAAVELAGFALTPFHSAHGRAGRVLRSGLVALAVYAALLGALMPRYGADGVAYASIGASLTILAQLAFSARQILRCHDKQGVRERLVDPAPPLEQQDSGMISYRDDGGGR